MSILLLVVIKVLLLAVCGDNSEAAVGSVVMIMLLFEV